MNDQALPRLYTEFAELWPLLSPPEDYAAEAESLRGILEEHLGKSPGGERRHRILELGAGGGHTLCHLAGDYDVTAMDLSHEMLGCCKDLIAGVKTVVGDMREFDLGQTYDAILCHDAIDYILSEGDLKKVFECAKKHLRPGGVFVVAPTYTREIFVNGEYAADQNCDESLELTFMSYVHDPDPHDDVFEMVLVYVIRKDGKVVVEEDRHTCAVFSEGQWVKWLEGVGFETKRYAEEEDGPCRLFVGVK